MVHAGHSLGDQLYSQITMPFYSAYIGLLATYDSHFTPHGDANDKVRCELAWSPDSFRWYRLQDESRQSHQSELIPTGAAFGKSDSFDCCE